MSEMSDAERLADIAQPGLKLWNEVEETDVRYVKSFDRGSFKGTAVDAIYNVKRISEKLGPVGFAWGWEVKSERLDTFGMGEDQQGIHTCVLRAWFRQPDGSKEHVEHVGHTKAAYWTRARRPGEKPRYIVDEEFGKKSVTDALSKIMVSLGASADIWLGRFDGNKYVSPSREEEAVAGEDEKLLEHARAILEEIRKRTPGPMSLPWLDGHLRKVGSTSTGSGRWRRSASGGGSPPSTRPRRSSGSRRAARPCSRWRPSSASTPTSSGRGATSVWRPAPPRPWPDRRPKQRSWPG